MDIPNHSSKLFFHKKVFRRENVVVLGTFRQGPVCFVGKRLKFQDTNHPSVSFSFCCFIFPSLVQTTGYICCRVSWAHFTSPFSTYSLLHSVCLSVYIHAHAPFHTLTNTDTRTQTRNDKRTHIQTRATHTHTNNHNHTYARKHTQPRATHTPMHTNTHTHAHTHACTQTRIHTRARAYTHSTQTHACAHTDTPYICNYPL